MENRKTVVLHMIETTGPGGAETVLLNVVGWLDPMEFESIVLLTGTGWLYDSMKAAGTTPLVAKSSGAFDWRFLREIMRVVRTRRVDLIHSHLPDANFYACLAGLFTRIPVVVTFHGMVGTWSTPSPKNRLKMALIKWQAKSVIAVSDHLKNELVQGWSFRPDQITRIYNGVDFGLLDQVTVPNSLRSEFGIPLTATLIGSVGNIRPAKGYEYLLNAARIVIDTAPDAYFVVVGEGHGELLAGLLALRSSLGLQERVFFAGFRSDVSQLLKQCDIFAMSSNTEGLSIATIEAMGLGKPVVVTNSGGPAEIVEDGKTGLLIPPQSADALAQGILRLIRDRELASVLGAAAKFAVRDRFCIKRSVKSYAELYRSCTG
jgi:glycosyltransferase involved in cell wall biosynthesis